MYKGVEGEVSLCSTRDLRVPPQQQLPRTPPEAFRPFLWGRTDDGAFSPPCQPFTPFGVGWGLEPPLHIELFQVSVAPRMTYRVLSWWTSMWLFFVAVTESAAETVLVQTLHTGTRTPGEKFPEWCLLGPSMGVSRIRTRTWFGFSA